MRRPATDTVCRAFADAYVAEGAKLPTETQEARYFDRLAQAYPIHPEIFDRLYEDWTTIDGFQRTRGVLKLMAKVIHKLWKDDNKDLLILPGQPAAVRRQHARNELLYYPAALAGTGASTRTSTASAPRRPSSRPKEPRFGAVQRRARGRAHGLPSAARRRPSPRDSPRASAGSTGAACCSAACSRARPRRCTPTRSIAWSTGCTT
jgi:hypothetical protein